MRQWLLIVTATMAPPLSKKKFFAMLEALDKDEDEDDVDQARGTRERVVEPAHRPLGEGSVHDVERQKATTTASKALLLKPMKATPPPISRTVSAPTGLLKDKIQHQPTEVRRTMSSSMATSSSAQVTLPSIPQIGRGKRKRDAVIKKVAPARQIFSGFQFYFCRNNDTDQLRALRIQKAIEFGGLWYREYHSGITHIVLDDDISYQDLLKDLKVSSLPPKVTVTNQKYLTECLHYGILLDSSKSYYKPEGTPAAEQPVLLSEPSAASPSSLPLKPYKRSDPLRDEREDRTPSIPRSVESVFQSSTAAFVSTGKTHRDEDDACPRTSPGAAASSSGDAAPSFNDELAQVMQEINETKHLPIDLEDEPASPKTTHDNTDSETEPPKKAPKLVKKKGHAWQEQFQCMQKHDGITTSENPNAQTIEMLDQMAAYYGKVNDEWRTRAYRKAIATLRKQLKKVTTKEEALELPFVGQRLAAKIEEIVLTRRLQRLENTKLEPNDEALQLFLNIYSVGLAQASRWVAQGYTTLEDVRKYGRPSENQKIGIAHYDDFLARIPRHESEAHAAIVKKALQDIDRAFEVTIMGSYRRGAKDSGDIDLIITKPDAPVRYLRNTVIEQLVPFLFTQGFLKAALAATSRNNGTKWHGASCLPNSKTWRRIDLLLVPWNEMGAALIYFTGNDIFNRSIRLLASKKGMRLNQCGLYADAGRGKDRQKIAEGRLLEGRSERRIFELLGVPWRPPHHRIC